MMSTERHRDNQVIEGRTVFITGAFGGIGQALVQSFLDAGVGRVIATSRVPRVASDARIECVVLDVCDVASVASVADRYDVDILVNNSGVNENSAPLVDTALESARAEMEANYFGVMNMCCAFAPRMAERGGGVIVNMLSRSVMNVVPQMASYCASKAAAWALTQGFRAELGGKGIGVIAIFPEATDTRLTAHLNKPKLAPKTVADATVAAIRQGVADQYVRLEAVKPVPQGAA